MSNASLVRLIARDLKLPGKRVKNVLDLLEEGSTVPFAARYRKDRTGNLGEGAIRRVKEGLDYCEKLAAAKEELIRQIDGRKRLSEELRRRIERATERNELDDISSMFRADGPTEAETARERGLGQIAVMLQMQRNPRRDIDALCEKLADPAKGVPDANAALQGALHILASQLAEDEENRRFVWELLIREAKVVARVVPGREEAGKIFESYFNFSAPVAEAQSKDLLTIRRGVSEGVLSTGLEFEAGKALEHLRGKLAHTSDVQIAGLLTEAAKIACDKLLVAPMAEHIRRRLEDDADTETIVVLKKNLRNLLLCPPAKGLKVLAIDPGFRGGCKLAALDEKGEFIDHSTIYLGQSKKRKETAREKIFSFVQVHRLDAICIGKGPGCRQAEILAREVIQDIKDRKVLRVTVNRSGVEQYARSEHGKSELPKQDEPTRAAVCIARRFQDPLKEYVKTDAWLLQLGPHQRQVNQEALKEKLKETVESCVNFVGADLNTASLPMLSCISGLSPELAQEIVKHRAEKGRFRTRAELLDLPGFSPQVFEQAAGFLRIQDGDEPLDGTGIHPEHYEFVRQIAAELGLETWALLGNPEALARVDWAKQQGKGIGKRAQKFIRAELSAPGRDPRGEFDPDLYHDGVQTVDDLAEGMILPGTVTNVTKFGAFVDIGVRMEGLVHVSQMSRRFIKDPTRVVSAGDRVMVKVLKVEKEKKRISLSIKQAKGKDLSAAPASPAARPSDEAEEPEAVAEPEGETLAPPTESPTEAAATEPSPSEPGPAQPAAVPANAAACPAAVSAPLGAAEKTDIERPPAAPAAKRARKAGQPDEEALAEDMRQQLEGLLHHVRECPVAVNGQTPAAPATQSPTSAAPPQGTPGHATSHPVSETTPGEPPAEPAQHS